MSFFDKVFSKKADDEQVEDFLNNFEGGTMNLSAIVGLLFSKGASAVSPFTLSVTIDQSSGFLDVLSGSDTLEISKNVTISSKNVTATLK